MKKYTKRLVAFLLATVMVLTGLPMNAKEVKAAEPTDFTVDFTNGSGTLTADTVGDNWKVVTRGGGQNKFYDGYVSLASGSSTAVDTYETTYEFDITAPAAGYYNFLLGARNTNGTINARVYVNGDYVGDVATYTSAQKFSLLGVYLVEGEHANTIRLEIYKDETVANNGKAYFYLKSFNFTVPTESAPLASVTFEATADATSLNVGETATITAGSFVTTNGALFNETKANYKYSYTSNPEGVVEAVEGGVKAVGSGNTIVTVAASIAGVSVPATNTIDFAVAGADFGEAIFNLEDNAELDLNEEYPLEVTASLTDGTDVTDKLTVEYASSNNEVAKIENGVLTAVGNGKAVITATVTYEGEEVATFERNILVGAFVVNIQEHNSSTGYIAMDTVSKADTTGVAWNVNSNSDFKASSIRIFGNYIQVKGDDIIFDFQAPSEGLYNLTAEVWHRSNQGCSAIYVNGTYVGNYDAYSTTEEAVEKQLLSVNLNKGTNTIQVICVTGSENTNIRAFKFVPATEEEAKAITGVSSTINGEKAIVVDLANLEEAPAKVDSIISTTDGDVLVLFESGKISRDLVDHVSSDGNVVYVNRWGELTYIGVGEVTITANVGEFTDTVTIKVVNTAAATVTYVDEDGTVFETFENVEIGAATPTIENPTKDADAEYTYTFEGWTPGVAETVTGDATYTATWTKTKKSYTVTWVVDGVETEETYEYGVVPTFKGSTDKAADDQYTYTFAGWDVTPVEVTGNVTYTAQYDKEVKSYTVTWVVDGAETTETYAYGATPTFKGSTDKKATDEFTFEFTSWDKDVVEVTGDVTYTAQYKETKRTYEITWVVDGVETVETYEYGETPAKADPTKEADNVNTYKFTGWTPEVVAVTGPATYTAVFEATEKYYAASINDTRYATFALAYEEAVAGDVIVLNDDLTMSGILEVDKAITLDGNGHTLTSTATRAINVSGADGVTIKNLTINASGERAINVIQNATNVTIEKVTATAANYAINVAGSAANAVIEINGSVLTGLNTVNVAADGANVEINDTKITCNDQTEVEAYGAISVNTDATVTVNGGEVVIIGDSVAAQIFADGTVTFNGTAGETEVKEVVATIGGGGFFTLEDAFEYASENGGTIVLSRDIALDTTVVNTGVVTLDLNGKTITGTDNKVTGEGNFYLINNSKGNLTITDSVGGGKITLVATSDREWNNSSVVVANNLGTVTLKAGTIEHLGGTSMAYGIDNLTNGKGTVANLYVEGGKVDSAYFAIRQFANNGTNNLTISGGEVSYAWMQSPNNNVNVATINVTGGTVAGICLTGKNADVTMNVAAGTTGEVYGTAPNGMIIVGTPETGFGLEKAIYADAIKANDRTYGEVIADGNKVTVKVTGEVEYDGSLISGSWNNWVGFAVEVPEGIDAEVAKVHSVTSGSVWSLAESLDTETTANFYWGIATATTKERTYQIDWNGDGTYELDVVIDVTNATLLTKEYTVTWVVDGVATEETYVAGTMPTAPEVKDYATAEKTYTFTGWDKEIVVVEADATYTAEFEATVNKYTVTWMNPYGVEITSESVEYGKLPTVPTATYKEYTFLDWDKEVVAVTEDVTYTAIYSDMHEIIDWRVIDDKNVGYYWVDGKVKGDAGVIEIDGNLYYVCYSGKIAADQNMTVAPDKTNGYVPADTYYFFANGVMENPADDLKGYLEEDENGVLWYKVNSEVRKNVGLVKVGDYFYYVLYSGKVKVLGNQTLSADKLNGFEEEAGVEAGKYYYFFENGIMETETVRLSGEVVDGEYRVFGELRKDVGLVKVGEYFYYVLYSGKVKVRGNQTLSADKLNGFGEEAGVEGGKYYYFFENGVLATEAVKMSGTIEDGYYKVFGEKVQDMGLVKIGDYFYYVLYSGKVRVGANQTITTGKSNGFDVVEEGKYYRFDEEGRLTIGGQVVVAE